MVGRESIELTKEQIIEATKKAFKKHGKLRMKYIAEELNVSYPIFLREKARHKLNPKTIINSQLEPSFEKRELTEENFQRVMGDIDEGTAKTIGYNFFSYKFEEDIIVRFIADAHIGANTSEHLKFAQDIKDIKELSNVKVFFVGDLIDNFSKYSVGGGVHSQAINTTKQKDLVEWAIKFLGKDKVLGMVQGCHEEWSYNSDGFDFTRYLCNKIGTRYLGKKAIVALEVGDNTYRIYLGHNERWGSNDNICHGLKKTCRQHFDFDIGIGAHNHTGNIEWVLIRGKYRLMIKLRGYKHPDRFIEKIKNPDGPLLTECVVLLADKQERLWEGMVPFLELEQAIRYL